MKPISIIRIVVFSLLLNVISNIAGATVYETVQSGNFSSSSTWKNGVVPPLTLGATDTIILPSSVPNIVLDRNLILDHNNSVMYIYDFVNVTESGPHFIAIKKGLFRQQRYSTISIDSFYLSGPANRDTHISGTDTFNKLTLSGVLLQSTSATWKYVKDLLHLKDGVSRASYQIGMAPNATIYFSDGGGLSGTQTVSIANPYYVKYKNANTAPPGDDYDELRGSGTTLMGIEIVGNVFLPLPDQTLILKDELKLTSGRLWMSFNKAPYFTLRFEDKGRFGSAGTGEFYGTDSVNISFYSYNVSTLGKVKFASGGNKLGLISLQLGGASHAALTLENDLVVSSRISLGNGSINIKDNFLDVTRVGSVGISFGNASSYIMMEPRGSVRVRTVNGGQAKLDIGTPNNYYPISFTADGNPLRLSVEDGVKENGTSGSDIAASQPAINATWYLLDNSTVANMQLGWQTVSEKNGFDRNHCFVSKYSGGSWDRPLASGATLNNSVYQAARNGNSTGGLYAIFDVNTTLSIEEMLSYEHLALYPNPTNNMLYLSYGGNGNATATVQSVSGKMVISTIITNGKNEIDVSALQSGVYFLNIAIDGISTTRKFVKQ